MGFFTGKPKEQNQVANVAQPNQTPMYANDGRINNPYVSPAMAEQQNMNQGFNQPMYGPTPAPQQQLKPNFSREELDNAEIPHQIAKEIKAEKFRIAGLLFLALISLTVSIFFVVLFYTVTPSADGTRLKIPAAWTPLPGFMFVLMLIGAIFLIMALIDYGHIKIQVKKYKGDILMGVEQIPYFLIRNYKSLIARPIYMNWLAFNIYIWGGIVIGIMFAIRAIAGTDDAGAYKMGMHTEIIIMITILCTTLFIHIVSLFVTRARKGNINSYYGYEIIPFDQVKDIRKRTNRICMIIFFVFLAIVLLVIVVPYVIVRKNKGKAIIPFI